MCAAGQEQDRTMTRLALSALALGLIAGCATHAARNERQAEPPAEPQYQIGLTGSRQTRNEAERTHAVGTLQIAPTAEFDSAPRVLSSPFPDYPPHLRRAGVEGRVVVRFTVEPDGSVGDPAVQGTAPPQLAALALDAIRQWRFTPAMKNGVPVRARLQQPFLFRME